MWLLPKDATNLHAAKDGMAVYNSASKLPKRVLAAVSNAALSWARDGTPARKEWILQGIWVGNITDDAGVLTWIEFRDSYPARKKAKKI